MKNLPENNAATLRMQQMLQLLRANYLAELPDRINDINELEHCALALRQAADFTQQFEELYRKLHSLKGGAGTYGLQIISTICHQLEESLTDVAGDGGKIDDDFLDRCVAYFDLMRLALKEAAGGKTSFPEVEAALAAMLPVATSASLTALLVESSKVNSTLYLAVLKDLPIRFSVVESGYEALGLLLHSRFDLLITGQETPLLNGIALIAAVRLNQRINRDIRAILITSSIFVHGIPPEAQPVALINRDERIKAELLREVQNCVRGYDKPA